MTELLSLSTIVKRDTVTIQSKKHPAGKTYELRNGADFGPLQYALLVHRQEECLHLQARKRLTKKQQARVDAILDELVRMIVLDLEPVVVRELTTAQKENLLVAWTIQVNRGAAGGAAEGNAKAAKRRSTGSK